MSVVADLALPVLPVEQPTFWANPDPFIEEARRQHPWLARFSRGFIVYGHQACADLLANDDQLKPGLGAIADFYGVRGTMWGRFMDEMVLNASGETHARLRASVARAFTPKQANLARPLMRKVISDLLDQWAPRGSFDFADFAALFPVAVVLGLLGVPADTVPRMRTALDNQLTSLTLDPVAKPLFMAGWDVLWAFADEIVSEREANGAPGEESLLDALIASKNAGQLDETELRFMILVLVVAGYDTSKNMLSFTIHLLLSRPEIWKRCAEDPDYCAKVVDEALRYAGIATPYRQVAEPFTYDGSEFPAGAMVVFATSLAGRDPALFPDPLTFDPERDNAKRHVSFGRGGHICLGQFIAKCQLEEGLHLITQRLRNPRLAGEVEWRPFLGAWGPKHLPIAFDATPAEEITA
jgi:cytochrome P450